MPRLATAQFWRFALAAAVLSLGFALPLCRLFSFAVADDLYSYIPLMPMVSAYLAWTLKSELPLESKPARLPALLFFVAGAAALAAYFALGYSGLLAAPENALGLAALAWLLCLAGVGCWCLGGATMRVLVFPFCLLLFMVPLPSFARAAIESGLQHASAMVADWIFFVAGTAFWRHDTIFQLPNISLEVAPECSGIHSTWVLLITSLVAARMILRRPWRRALLCLAIIPLALLRNGFRVFVIGELCIHVGPGMIDSPIHHHGGPIFFALSLIPMFLLLYVLRRGEQKKPQAGKA
ncbi:MAG TPA: exosortase/archaeosortase family protein [Candidatus Acidoferrales bacterium]|nr:exosortase/archaeosortase family protein [Candidatus Acidoferrales bacterium]